MKKLNNAFQSILYCFILLCLPLAACSQEKGNSESNSAIELDYLFVGGLVFDGTSNEPAELDVGVKDGEILFLGDADASSVDARKIFDVAGKWLAPGFIDMHSHARLETDYGYQGTPFLYQGITTAVVGVDGMGTSEIQQLKETWTEQGIGINALAYVGHGHIRNQVMGTADRKPTKDELQAMKALVQKGMDEGAFGLSTGLFYVPGTYADTDEVIELAKVAARYNGAIYDTHDRDLGAVYKGVGYDASVQEAIRITEDSGLRGIFSHYNLQGRHNYGRGDAGAGHINEARERGVDIWAAHHPYTATQSRLSAYTVPGWAAAGGQEAMNTRFDDAETSAKIVAATAEMLDIRGGAQKLLFADARPHLSGKTLADVASGLNLSPALAVQYILRDGDAGVMNLDLYDINNTRRLAREPWMMTCSDGVMPRPEQKSTHPRSYGAFPMKMRLFVFEEGVLSPEFVIRSFSGLAADFLGLNDRGYIREGYMADLVVFDPNAYRDLATYENPKQYSQGMQHVLVNGGFAIRDGVSTNILTGQAISRVN